MLGLERPVGAYPGGTEFADRPFHRNKLDPARRHGRRPFLTIPLTRVTIIRSGPSSSEQPGDTRASQASAIERSHESRRRLSIIPCRACKSAGEERSGPTGTRTGRAIIGCFAVRPLGGRRYRARHPASSAIGNSAPSGTRWRSAGAFLSRKSLRAATWASSSFCRSLTCLWPAESSSIVALDDGLDQVEHLLDIRRGRSPGRVQQSRIAAPGHAVECLIDRSDQESGQVFRLVLIAAEAGRDPIAELGGELAGGVRDQAG